MDADYFQNARKWYNTIYVNAASERIIYFLIFAISLVSFYFALQLVDIFYEKHGKVERIVVKIIKENPEYKGTLHTVPLNANNDISILNFILTKYVENAESLIYDGNETTASDAINLKTNIIKNLSLNDVYQKFVKKMYSMEDSDFELVILKQKKIASITNIESINEENYMISRLQNIARNDVPTKADVYFSVENTDENTPKKNYVAHITYIYSVDPNHTPNSKVNFKVADYTVEEIV